MRMPFDYSPDALGVALFLVAGDWSTSHRGLDLLDGAGVSGRAAHAGYLRVVAAEHFMSLNSVGDGRVFKPSGS